MKRILFIFSNLTNVFSSPKYSKNYNSGNFVFLSAGASFFYDTENVVFDTLENISIRLKDNPNVVKDNFDIAIMMQANIFCHENSSSMLMLSRIIKKLKIPMFILGAGVQSSLDYSDEFLLSISEPSKIFLDTVFESGGDITLRGDFSKYCLEKLGYKNLFVSGCPSLFMCGFSDNVLNKKVNGRK